MSTWILIFAINYGRAPSVATFYDKAACESAIREIERAREVKYGGDFAICVPAASTRSGSEG